MSFRSSKIIELFSNPSFFSTFISELSPPTYPASAHITGINTQTSHPEFCFPSYGPRDPPAATPKHHEPSELVQEGRGRRSPAARGLCQCVCDDDVINFRQTIRQWFSAFGFVYWRGWENDYHEKITAIPFGRRYSQMARADYYYELDHKMATALCPETDFDRHEIALWLNHLLHHLYKEAVLSEMGRITALVLILTWILHEAVEVFLEGPGVQVSDDAVLEAGQAGPENVEANGWSQVWSEPLTAKASVCIGEKEETWELGKDEAEGERKDGTKETQCGKV
ncbi:hypothetical protein D9619_008600 [Psilocybe cf. subviscida]|uniref:Uncharacterized protein n=1 Tax=Psilocybe cf. subviscida TaxID=2480587 RepID=A0A8H5BBA8_9AGAR|nr:hypothetical protein D9619_008600 [Psilocybe cf. subviscida]